MARGIASRLPRAAAFLWPNAGQVSNYRKQKIAVTNKCTDWYLAPFRLSGSYMAARAMPQRPRADLLGAAR